MLLYIFKRCSAQDHVSVRWLRKLLERQQVIISDLWDWNSIGYSWKPQKKIEIVKSFRMSSKCLENFDAFYHNFCAPSLMNTRRKNNRERLRCRIDHITLLYETKHRRVNNKFDSLRFCWKPISVESSPLHVNILSTVTVISNCSLRSSHAKSQLKWHRHRVDISIRSVSVPHTLCSSPLLLVHFDFLLSFIDCTFRFCKSNNKLQANL